MEDKNLSRDSLSINKYEYNVSIIIPIYNVERYIEECLNSIFSQTVEDGIECILVDDCGQDNSVSIAKECISKYKGDISFSFLHHDHNKGLSAARNTGAKNARGKYLLFVDSDDKLYPHTIESMWSLAVKYPGVELVQGSENNIFKLNKRRLPEYSDNVEWVRKAFCTGLITDAAWNRLVLKDFFFEHDVQFAEGYIQEDTLWSFQLQKYITSIAFCFENTYFYRFNPDGIMQSASKEKTARQFSLVYNIIYSSLCKGSRKDYEIIYLALQGARIIKNVGESGYVLLDSERNNLMDLLYWLINLPGNTILEKCFRKLLYTMHFRELLATMLNQSKYFPNNSKISQ